MKFSQMKYVRPEFEETNAKAKALLSAFKDAKNPEEAFAAYKQIDSFNRNVQSMFSIANIRNTIDTRDEYYDKEKTYMDETRPKLMEVQQAITSALLASPYRKELEAEWGTLMFDKAEMQLKTFKPEIVADLQEENKLGSEYDKLIASAQIQFDGKTLTLAQLTPYYEAPDRSVREAAVRAQAAWFMERAEQFDTIYDKLVKVRTRIAKTLGYENFIELGYYRMTRICYNREKVEKFREGVHKYIVPIVKTLKAEQAKRIGVDSIKVFDDRYEYTDGNAKPKGTADDIFAHGKKMYHELSAETAEFIDFMMENELFDVLARPGKSAGGYCAYIDDHKSPFIFANFNGTRGDIDVLTHEAGHAFAAYGSKDIYPAALRRYTSETAEVHSMGMEFFTWPWMEGFFGEQTGKYRLSHLAGALSFIPYGTMVDDFQHHVYQKPDMTPKERNECWLALEKKYRPYLDQSGIPFYGDGRRWQSQMHIFRIPFYYIDYCLARVISLVFWAEDQKNHKESWGKYCRLVGFAGTKTFSDLIADAGLPSPFIPETLKIVADAAVDWLNSQKG
ncbi:MAG: M3 family oligoendopeptidase [Treponema sp.]|nr:M3 family oligoendopeptidase [Treponema sp.]